MLGAIILGIVAGFLGRFLMPGKDKMGFIATTVLGLAGAVVGWLVLSKLLGIGNDHAAFNLGGLGSALVGVLILLGVFRLYRHHEDSQHRFGRSKSHTLGT